MQAHLTDEYPDLHYPGLAHKIRPAADAGAPDTRVVLPGVYETDAHRAAADAAGASAYVARRTMATELVPILSTWLHADSMLIPTLSAAGGQGGAGKVEW